MTNWHKKPNVQIYNKFTRKWDLYEFDSQVTAIETYLHYARLGCKVSLFYGSVTYKEAIVPASENKRG